MSNSVSSKNSKLEVQDSKSKKLESESVLTDSNVTHVNSQSEDKKADSEKISQSSTVSLKPTVSSCEKESIQISKTIDTVMDFIQDSSVSSSESDQLSIIQDTLSKSLVLAADKKRKVSENLIIPEPAPIAGVTAASFLSVAATSHNQLPNILEKVGFDGAATGNVSSAGLNLGTA